MAKNVSDDFWARTIASTKTREKHFKLSMVEYPCSFNIGLSNNTLDSHAALVTSEPTEPYFADSNCKRLECELKAGSDDEDFEEIVWKDNLRTRVFHELGKKQEAIDLNEKILHETNNNNLTALTNSAFLNFYQEETKRVQEVMKKLQEIQKSANFKDLKLQAIIEQAYAYRKLGGCSNLLCAIQLLSSTSEAVPEDEKVKFMLALCYRRCSSPLMMYVDDASKVDRKTLAKEAAQRFHELGTTAKDKSIKAAAIAELAFLRRSDSIKECRLIDSLDWEDLIGNRSWKQLCFKALEVDEDNPNDRVLKMVGQMFKSDIRNRDHGIQLLNKWILMNPSSRAYHHLGLIYVKKAVAFDREAFDREAKIKPLQSGHQPQIHLQSEHQPQIHLQSEHQPEIQLQSGHQPQIQLQSENQPEIQLQSEHQRPIQLQSENQPEIQLQSGHQPQIQLQLEHQPQIQLQLEHQPQIQLQSEHQPQIQLQSENQFEIQLQSEHQPQIQLQSENQPEIQLQSEHQPPKQLQSEHQPQIQLQSEHQPQIQLQSENQPEIQLQSEHQPPKQLQSEHQPQIQLQSEHQPQIQLQSEHQQGPLLLSEPQPQLLLDPHSHYKKNQSLEERLSYHLKVVKKRLRPFSDGNPHIRNAEENLRKAVEVSFNVNIVAQYDLAFLLARQCNYNEAKRICKDVIEDFTNSQAGFHRRLYFVNIYHLYGMCYVLEAEEADDEETRNNLLDRSQEILMDAIRLATEIASSVPELKRCATDLWQAFNQLQEKFRFQSDPESKKQMFKLCELVADYRWLPELGEMLSIENSEWQDQRCLEIYLQKYIQEKDFDKADHFLNLIATRPNPCILNINNSETVQQLRFEQMKLASEKAIAEENLMDPIWKKIMDEVYLKPSSTDRSEHLNTISENSQDGKNTAKPQDGTNTTNSRDGANTTNSQDGANTTDLQDSANTTNSQDGAKTTNSQDGANTTDLQDGTNTTNSQDGANTTNSQDGANPTNSQDGKNNDNTNLLDNHGMVFDVMLVEDSDSCPDVKDGFWSHKASDRIKSSLKGKCGLTVERLQDRRIPGNPHWKMSYICMSKVVIFLFGVPQTVTTTDMTRVADENQTAEAIRRLSLSSSSGTNEPDRVSNRSCYVVNDSNRQHQSQTYRRHVNCSAHFKDLLLCAIGSMLRDERPRQIIIAVQSEEDKLLIPSEALGKPVLVISDEDISVLASTSSGDLPKQYELIMNIFKQLVSK